MKGRNKIHLGHHNPITHFSFGILVQINLQTRTKIGIIWVTEFFLSLPSYIAESNYKPITTVKLGLRFYGVYGVLTSPLHPQCSSLLNPAPSPLPPPLKWKPWLYYSTLPLLSKDYLYCLLYLCQGGEGQLLAGKKISTFKVYKRKHLTDNFSVYLLRSV